MLDRRRRFRVARARPVPNRDRSGGSRVERQRARRRATAGARLAIRAASTSAVPPPWVRRAMEAIEAHLTGQLASFADLPLDLKGVPPFHRRVYDALRQIEPGRTASYAELAKRAGAPGAARAVGEAMRKNPLPIVIPCHRVLAAGGAGGFSAHGGLATKARLLAIEGVEIDAPRAAKPRRARIRRAADGPTLFDSI